MRKILFRGKSKVDDKWIYGIPIKTHIGTYIVYEEKPHVCTLYGYMEIDEFQLIDETAMGQSIGLKDINGEKIYEGDIVDWVFFRYYGTEEEYHLRGIIEWYQGGFIYRVIKNDFENCEYYGISSLNTDTESECEIVGNIYDNPELLKK